MMKKIFFIIYLLLTNFCFAQNSDRDTIVEGKNYHFDVSLEIKTVNAGSDSITRTNTKLINTKDDSYFGFGTSMKQITVFDLENNYILTFKKDSIEGDKKLKFKNGSKFSLKNSNKYKVKVKKLAEKQFEITKINRKEDHFNLRIVVNVEKSEWDTANSLSVDDMINLDYAVINILRKKVNFGLFIITDSQSYFNQKAKSKSNTSKSERIDLTLTIPKNTKLKFPLIVDERK